MWWRLQADVFALLGFIGHRLPRIVGLRWELPSSNMEKYGGVKQGGINRAFEES
jgi:hypothetical protein